jgi:hypothetical protein
MHAVIGRVKIKPGHEDETQCDDRQPWHREG